MAETRLYMASQGYLNSIDEVQRGWTVVGLFVIAIFFLIGYLITRHNQRRRAERFRAQGHTQPRNKK
ncbi:MAG: hypothetical protein H7839_16180 [Magnetococcus sp. YQC-5]